MHGLTELQPGARVRAGLRVGTVVRAERRHRQDGYVVQYPASVTLGDGYLPHWVPAYLVKPEPACGPLTGGGWHCEPARCDRPADCPLA